MPRVSHWRKKGVAAPQHPGQPLPVRCAAPHPAPGPLLVLPARRRPGRAGLCRGMPLLQPHLHLHPGPGLWCADAHHMSHCRRLCMPPSLQHLSPSAEPRHGCPPHAASPPAMNFCMIACPAATPAPSLIAHCPPPRRPAPPLPRRQPVRRLQLVRLQPLPQQLQRAACLHHAGRLWGRRHHHHSHLRARPAGQEVIRCTARSGRLNHLAFFTFCLFGLFWPTTPAPPRSQREAAMPRPPLAGAPAPAPFPLFHFPVFVRLMPQPLYLLSACTYTLMYLVGIHLFFFNLAPAANTVPQQAAAAAHLLQTHQM